MSVEARRHFPIDVQSHRVLRFISRRARVKLRDLLMVSRFVNRYGHYVRPNRLQQQSLDHEKHTFDMEDGAWNRRHGPVAGGARIIPFKRLELNRTDAAVTMPQTWGNFLSRTHDRALAASLEQLRKLVERPDVDAGHATAAAQTGARPAPKTEASGFSGHYHLHHEDEDPN